MAISVFDLFSVGIGPSSSHTVGPMRAARLFAQSLAQGERLAKVHRVTVELFGSLGATGKGHGTPKAILWGLSGEKPEDSDINALEAQLIDIRRDKKLDLFGSKDTGGKSIEFIESRDLLFSRHRSLPFHSNGMQFIALDQFGLLVDCKVYYSVGGGFVIDESATGKDVLVEDSTPMPYPFDSGDELLALCDHHNRSISELMLENEKVWRSEDSVKFGLLQLWRVMQNCIERGCNTDGILPGGLRVKRRAPDLY